MTDEDLLVAVLSHPATFDIGCCGILGIRSTDQGTFEVEYEGDDETTYVKTSTHTYWTFTDIREAVRFYLSKIEEKQLG